MKINQGFRHVELSFFCRLKSKETLQHSVGLIEKSRGEITRGHHKPCSEAAHQSVNNSGLLKSRALFKSQQVNIENRLGQAIAWLNER